MMIFVTRLIWLFAVLVIPQLSEILGIINKVCFNQFEITGMSWTRILTASFLDGPKAAEIRARKMNRGWMQRNKVGPDGFLQLSLQLASYRLTGMMFNTRK